MCEYIGNYRFVKRKIEMTIDKCEHVVYNKGNKNKRWMMNKNMRVVLALALEMSLSISSSCTLLRAANLRPSRIAAV